MHEIGDSLHYGVKARSLQAGKVKSTKMLLDFEQAGNPLFVFLCLRKNGGDDMT